VDQRPVLELTLNMLIGNWACRLVNFGLHAGMGADALTGFALSKAKKGDTVLVMLEPELLADSEMETALGVQFSHAIGAAGNFKLGWCDFKLSLGQA
jgi:hypothetical protein